MEQTVRLFNLPSLLRRRPDGVSRIRGSEEYKTIGGLVRFWQTEYGVLVVADLTGLPDPGMACETPVFGFHIHSGGSCTGNREDPFADALTHYNPKGCPHPFHAGDLPPLFGNRGRAFLAVLTDRFSVKEIIGRTVIVHGSPDDFTSQPAGNAGHKIACGSICKG